MTKEAAKMNNTLSYDTRDLLRALISSGAKDEAAQYVHFSAEEKNDDVFIYIHSESDHGERIPIYHAMLDKFMVAHMMADDAAIRSMRDLDGILSTLAKYGLLIADATEGVICDADAIIDRVCVPSDSGRGVTKHYCNWINDLFHLRLTDADPFYYTHLRDRFDVLAPITLLRAEAVADIQKEKIAQTLHIFSTRIIPDFFTTLECDIMGSDDFNNVVLEHTPKGDSRSLCYGSYTTKVSLGAEIEDTSIEITFKALGAEGDAQHYRYPDFVSLRDCIKNANLPVSPNNIEIFAGYDVNRDPDEDKVKYRQIMHLTEKIVANRYRSIFPDPEDRILRALIFEAQVRVQESLLHMPRQNEPFCLLPIRNEDDIEENVPAPTGPNFNM